MMRDEIIRWTNRTKGDEWGQWIIVERGRQEKKRPLSQINTKEQLKGKNHALKRHTVVKLKHIDHQIIRNGPQPKTAKRHHQNSNGDTEQ